MLSRRGLLTGLASLLAAPAIVRASSLMPVKELSPDPFEGWRVYKWNDGLSGDSFIKVSFRILQPTDAERTAIAKAA